MELKLFKTLWGHEGTLTDAVQMAAIARFDGIEGPVPDDPEERAEFQHQLDSHQQELIAEVCTGGSYVPSPYVKPGEHLDDLKRGIERSLLMKPRFVNTMTGLDAWPFSEQVAYFEQVLLLGQEYGVDITIETHRSRSTFNPWVTRELVKALPELKLNLDFSHWCCISERLVLDDDPDMLHLFARHGAHLHGRIGYDQGPQVPDPRAPEYLKPLVAHLDWWRTVWSTQRDLGREVLTMTPEFGPDGYLHLEPYTRKPVADLWEINQWMGTRLREEFAAWEQQDIAA